MCFGYSWSSATLVLRNPGETVKAIGILQPQVGSEGLHSSTARDWRALYRLKQQMVAEQDEEDDKLRWRVDAEVQAAVAEVRASADAKERRADSAVSELRTKLNTAEQRVQRLTADLEAWEAAVAERDAELRNLQVRKYPYRLPGQPTNSPH